MAKAEKNEIAVVSSAYPALAGESNFADVMKENFQGEKLTISTLAQIKIPSGGGTQWAIPSLGGEKYEKSFDAVVTYAKRVRTYWSDPDSTGESPDCRSDDSVVGKGDPGGDCVTCPMAKWDSSPKGGGQACKQQLRLFLMRPGQLLPTVLSLPPTSLIPWRTYAGELTSNVKYHYGVVTRFGLEVNENAAGQKFSSVTLEVADGDYGIFDAATVEKVVEYRHAISGLFD